MNTAVKVLSATTPTKKAATHSIESMKRSMKFLRTGSGGPVIAPSWVTSADCVMRCFDRLPRRALAGRGLG
ncbi:hypothetical protein [Bradyrhizobium embrapense]